MWRSVRDGGDTKTRKSRRTLALPALCARALTSHKADQDSAREKAGGDWQETGLVFTSQVGTALDAANVRRAFRRVVKLAGLNQKEWTPRELRHSFVSLLSDSGMSLGEIADLVGHAGTTVTEKVYRHQLRPILPGGGPMTDEAVNGPTGRGPFTAVPSAEMEGGNGTGPQELAPDHGRRRGVPVDGEPAAVM